MRLRPLRGRQADLSRLRHAVTQAGHGQAQLLVVAGPRRVGKTFLLHHLLAELPDGFTPVYFEATQAGAPDQLRRFADALTAALGPDAPPIGTAQTWEQALAACAYVARRRSLVVVLDEATYLMTSTPGFTSMVKAVWDRLVVAADQPQLVLVLTGSAVGLMDDALDHSGPLYGRPTDVLRLRPFTAAEASRFCGQPDPAPLLEAYAACGGYPLHLDAWDFEQGTEDNLLRLAGSPGGLLVEDADLLLATLPEGHRRVLIAVGQGRARRGEILNEVGARIERPLEALLRARFVRAATPLGAPLKARPEYRVDDAYLRFWFRCLSNGVQRIEAGQGRAVLGHTAGEWQVQLGWTFEQAAREHAAHLVSTGELPAGAQVDEWWTVSGAPCQIDVLGMQEHRTVFGGEARWQRQPLGPSAVEDLARKVRLAPQPVPQPGLLLWGRGGVRPEVQVGAVRGFGPAEMLRR
jgi:AAA+ ATPase superfamily predicted ATPase